MTKFKMNRGTWQGLAVLLLAGCGGKPKAATTATPQDAAPLSGLVGQPLLITPTQKARVAPELNWSGVPKAADLLAAVDSGMVNTLHARDPVRNWVFGDALLLNFTRYPTTAPDPRALGVEPLGSRAGTIKPGTRLTEPLASQLRTMIALHDVRLVLVPVELRFEAVDGTPAAITAGAPRAGRAVLRIVVIDPRASEVKWMSEVKGDPAPSYGPGLIASLVTKVANLFIAP